MICFELQCSEELQTAHTTIFPYTIDGVPFWMRYYMKPTQPCLRQTIEPGIPSIVVWPTAAHCKGRYLSVHLELILRVTYASCRWPQELQLNFARELVGRTPFWVAATPSAAG